MSSSTSTGNSNNQSNTPRSNIGLLIAAILALLTAIIIAIFTGNTSTADLFGLRRLLGGGFTGFSSRIAPLRHLQSTPTAPALSGSLAAKDAVRANMRTPIYFLSHGGVCIIFS